MLGVTQLAVADSSGVSAKTVGNIEAFRATSWQSRAKVRAGLERLAGGRVAFIAGHVYIDGVLAPYRPQRRAGRLALVKGDAISLARFKAAWTASELAHRMDVALSTIEAWEAATEARIRPELAARLARVFGAVGVELSAG